MKDHLETMRQIARTQRRRAEAAEARVNELERFICHSGGLVNEWAKSCPVGTKMTDHIKDKLNDYLKHNL